ncbi:HD domain-containing protein [Sphaerisporangium perillae]|uniref:HD domain-containing protein n=1 Tax=Sphaerisporangium perillae TaxID=2935860 RepID=UPI00200C5ED1|nr:HD domain-containing protein [Sphaerisporangium perillae]
MRLDDIVIPDSPAARAALEVATAYCSPALLNHSVRSYLWAASYAEPNGIGFDAELLYVSALLHDIGLVKEFDSHTVPFEEAGGHVAWVFGAAAGWPAERRTRASEVIVRHMWDRVDVTEDPEGHLLELATGLDISGRRPEAWPAALRAEVLGRLPRLDLGKEFTACFQDQAERKPGSTAGQAVGSGIAGRIAANPLEAAEQA